MSPTTQTAVQADPGAAETQLRIAQELAQLGTWEWDLVTGLALGSRELFRIAGFGDDSRRAAFDEAFSIVHPDDVAALDEALRRAVDERALFQHEYRVVCADGTELIMHARGQLVFDASGAPVRMIGISQDVTEQQRSERALLESEERYRNLIAHLPEVTWRSTEEEKPLFISPNVQGLWGYAAEEMIDGGIELWARRIHPADRDRVLRAYRALFDPGLEYDVEYRFQRKDNAWMWVHDRAVVVVDDRRVPHAFGVMSDVTARHFSEEALRKSEARYRALVEQANDIIFTTDVEGHLTSLNRAFEHVTGWPVTDWIGRPFRDLIAPAALPEAMEHFRAVMRGESYCAEYQVRAQDGQLRILETTAQALIVNRQVTGTVGIARDVTRRREQEAQAEKDKRMASLGHLAASVAHEFNNVLMSILPFAEILKRRVPNDERAALAIKHIFQAVARGRQVTQEILRLARPVTVTLGAVDVREWLADFARQTAAMLGPRYQLSTRIHAEGELFVRADRTLLDQVAMNLIINARDAMPDGGQVSILASRAAEGIIEIDVADTGHGIEPELVDRIFDPLFTTKRSGTGLGLSIAYQTMLQQEGSLRVRSRFGEGSTFTLSLRETAAPMRPAEVTAPRRATAKRVLLVEDEEAVGQGIRALLEAEGFEVTLVTEGRAAMGAVERFSPEVVVLDVNLPDISGTEVYEELHARHPSLPVIFSTGHADAHALDDLRARGVPSIMKPYDIAELVALIAEEGVAAVKAG